MLSLILVQCIHDPKIRTPTPNSFFPMEHLELYHLYLVLVVDAPCTQYITVLDRLWRQWSTTTVVIQSCSHNLQNHSRRPQLHGSVLKGINRDKAVGIALALFDLCYTHTISHTLPYIPCTPSDLRGRVAFGHSLTIQTRLRPPVALGGKNYQINSDNRYQIGIFMQISHHYFWANQMIDHGSNWRPAHIL